MYRIVSKDPDGHQFVAGVFTKRETAYLVLNNLREKFKGIAYKVQVKG